MSDCDTEFSETETDVEISKNLELMIKLNNNLVKTINYLEKLNVVLCQIVSSINNIKFTVELKQHDIQERL